MSNIILNTILYILYILYYTNIHVFLDVETKSEVTSPAYGEADGERVERSRGNGNVPTLPSTSMAIQTR